MEARTFATANRDRDTPETSCIRYASSGLAWAIRYHDSKLPKTGKCFTPRFNSAFGLTLATSLDPTISVHTRLVATSIAWEKSRNFRIAMLAIVTATEQLQATAWRRNYISNIRRVARKAYTPRRSLPVADDLIPDGVRAFVVGAGRLDGINHAPKTVCHTRPHDSAAEIHARHIEQIKEKARKMSRGPRLRAGLLVFRNPSRHHGDIPSYIPQLSNTEMGIHQLVRLSNPFRYCYERRSLDANTRRLYHTWRHQLAWLHRLKHERECLTRDKAVIQRNRIAYTRAAFAKISKAAVAHVFVARVAAARQRRTFSYPADLASALKMEVSIKLIQRRAYLRLLERQQKASRHEQIDAAAGIGVC